MVGYGRKQQPWLWWQQETVLLLLGALLLVATRGALGIRFVIDKKECWQHEVPYDGDQVHVSYVVIKSESMWSFDDNPKGLDLVVSLLWVLLVFLGALNVAPNSIRLLVHKFYNPKSNQGIGDRDPTIQRFLGFSCSVLWLGFP